MIDITNIKAGWLDLHIDKRIFHVSYLTDVVSELNGFCNLPPSGAKVFFFDGEGIELYLLARKEYEDIILIWEEHDRKGNVILDRFECNYDQFWNEWKELWDKIKDNYLDNFDLDNFMSRDEE